MTRVERNKLPLPPAFRQFRVTRALFLPFSGAPFPPRSIHQSATYDNRTAAHKNRVPRHLPTSHPPPPTTQ